MENDDMLMAATDADGMVHGLGDRKNMTFRVERVDERRVRLVPDGDGTASTDGKGLLSGAGLPPLTAFNMTEDGDRIMLERLDGHEDDVRLVTDDAFWDRVMKGWHEPAVPLRI